jgi:hypothetical protein
MGHEADAILTTIEKIGELQVDDAAETMVNGQSH